MNQCSPKPVVSRRGCASESSGEPWGKVYILWMTPDLDNQRLLRCSLETTLQAPQGTLMQPAQHLSENQSLGTTTRDHHQGWTKPELGLAVSGRISCLAVEKVSLLYQEVEKEKGKKKMISNRYRLPNFSYVKVIVLCYSPSFPPCPHILSGIEVVGWE